MSTCRKSAQKVSQRSKDLLSPENDVGAGTLGMAFYDYPILCFRLHCRRHLQVKTCNPTCHLLCSLRLSQRSAQRVRAQQEYRSTDFSFFTGLKNFIKYSFLTNLALNVLRQFIMFPRYGAYVYLLVRKMISVRCFVLQLLIVDRPHLPS